MIQIDIGEMFLAFIAAMGIPSAIMGLVVWRLKGRIEEKEVAQACLLYTSPSPRDRTRSRMPSSA